MIKYHNDTIKKFIENLNTQYFLPAIQRDFIWNEERIINLFDSIMRGYPISSFLLWSIPKSVVDRCKFYEFIKNFDDRKNQNEEVSLNGHNGEIISILDGQQRLTSLFIGLKGSYTVKQAYYQKNSTNAYKTKRLYLNLAKLNNDDDINNKYQFNFREGSDDVNTTNHWLEVGKILDLNHDDIDDYVDNINIEIDKKIIRSNLRLLKRVICEEHTINYYKEDTDELDKVLNIFIRINSGGEKLKFSDLLLSVLTSYFKKIDIKKELFELVKNINEKNNFNIDKDFVLKTSLFLLGQNIKFKIENFTKDEVVKGIEDNFENIKTAIINACNILNQMGFSKEVLNSNYPITIVAYHLYKLNKERFVNDVELNDCKMFIILSYWNRLFGGSTDDILEKIRKHMNDSNYQININSLEQSIGSKKSVEITINEEYLYQPLYPRYKKDIYNMMFILYPSFDFRNKFQIDHIYPISLFSKKNLKKKFQNISDDKINELYCKANSIANMQLLPASNSVLDNQSKSDSLPIEWLNKVYNNDQNKINDFKSQHYISSSSSLLFNNIEDFENFIKNRAEEMYKTLKNVMNKK